LEDIVMTDQATTEKKDVDQDLVNRIQGANPGQRDISQGDPTGHGEQPTSPTEQADPQVRSGAGVDIDSGRMPADGVLEVHDTDEDILDEEKQHSIASNGPRKE
jgi:hypothetical protein